MRRLLAGFSAVAAMSLSSAVWAEESRPPEGIQALGAGDAVAACYVDTSAWEVLMPGSCFSMASPYTTQVVFGVQGIDQSGGRYVVQFLDGTCESTGYTLDEGNICLRTIRHYQTLSQRVQVYDTWTGQWSGILTAEASYEGFN
ncbi:hypothetical protein [Corallococcus exercitus]|uniref:hypothetical protein n=1 Tax=Corallococcus exercitus TaxID=2316736 RepID=UPI0035D4EC57